MDSWFGSLLGEGGDTPDHPHQSGYKSKRVQKVGTAESLAQQGFQDFVPTVPSVPTGKQSPRKSADSTPTPGNSFSTVGDIAAGIVTAVATGQPTPAPALPADLLERVNLICRLEQWPAADRAEWLGILRRQIEQDGTPVRELVACLDAHLAKHHAGVAGDDDREAFEERAAIMQHDGGLSRADAEEQAGKVNECLTCLHWRGETTIPSGKQQVLSLVNPASSFRQNKVIGACKAKYRPWRSSSDPAQSQYLQWVFIGQCAHTPAGKGKTK